MSLVMNKEIARKLDEKTANDSDMQKFLHEILTIEIKHEQFKKPYTQKIEKYTAKYEGTL